MCYIVCCYKVICSSFDSYFTVGFIFTGLNAVKDLGIKPTLSAVELSQPDVNELQVMALASSMRKVKSKKTEPPKPVKIEWGKCARFSDVDMEGADRSDEVFQNTKGMVTHVGLTNAPVGEVKHS